jgi:hypothetical protein
MEGSGGGLMSEFIPYGVKICQVLIWILAFVASKRCPSLRARLTFAWFLALYWNTIRPV